MSVIGDVAGTLFPAAEAAPSVRKPVCEVKFGGASADEWAQALVGFSVESGAAPWVDAATVYAASARGPASAPGDAGHIKAGYADASADVVFTGRVETVRYGLDGITRLGAATGAALLARLRINQAYEQLTAGDIVRDLASKASIETDAVEDGATYAFYAIDDRRSAWEHIAALARKSGFRAFLSAEGKLNFRPVEAGGAVQIFSYGQDVLALELTHAVAAASGVTMVGEGAAGSNGSDAWSWLLKDASAATAQAGEGAPALLRADASLRSLDASQAAADAIAAAVSGATLGGWLLTAGAPAVSVGSTIEIAGALQPALNGVCVVDRVVHRFGKGQGFTTRIAFRQTGPGSAGGGDGLLGAVTGLL
jgi:phage protein D